MTNKMTNVKALAYVLENCELPEDVQGKLTAIKASYEKRNNTNKPHAPTKVQRENAVLAEKIASAMVAGETYYTTDIENLVDELHGASSQKVTGVMRGLLKAQKVTVTKEKGKSVYTLA